MKPQLSFIRSFRVKINGESKRVLMKNSHRPVKIDNSMYFVNIFFNYDQIAGRPFLSLN